MTKPVSIYFLHGQGGIITSSGIDQMASQVAAWGLGINVKTLNWDNWQQVVTEVNLSAGVDTLRMACGYSMGANAVTWILGGVTSNNVFAPGVTVPFDYAAFLDPTWLSTITQLSPTRLKKGVHFKNTSLDIPGHATIPAPGVFLDVISTFESHLSVDTDQSVQQRVLSDMRALIGG